MSTTETARAARTLNHEIAATRRFVDTTNGWIARIKARLAARILTGATTTKHAPDVFEDLYYPDGKAVSR